VRRAELDGLGRQGMPTPPRIAAARGPLTLLAVALAAGFAVVDAAGPADADKERALEALTRQDLLCGGCKYLFDWVDQKISKESVAGFSEKKTRKWLKKTFRPQVLCSDARYSTQMGLFVGGDKPMPVDNAMKWAQGSGYGHKDPSEFSRIAKGTHNELNVAPTIGKDLQVVCQAWVRDLRPLVKASLEQTLMDGESLKAFVCHGHLKVCSKRHVEF